MSDILGNTFFRRMKLFGFWFFLFACGGLGAVVQQTLAPSDSGVFSSLALGTQGRPVVAFTELVTNSSSVKILFCLNLGCSDRKVKVLDDVFGYHVSLAIQSNGNPFVSYSTTSEVFAITCQDTECDNFSKASLLPSVANSPGWTSAAIVNDNPSVAFVANEGSRSVVYVSSCKDNPCSTEEAYSYPVLNALQWGSDRNMAVLGQNNPYIAFYIDGTGLVLLSCFSFECQVSSSRVLDTYSYNNDVGLYPSVAVSANNLAVVSYHDASNLALKMAFCSDIFCSFVTTRAFPSTYGWDAVVTFDLVNGFPIVGYSNPATASLVVMSCADATCEESSSFALRTEANRQFETVKMVSSSFYQPLMLAHTSNNELESVFVPASENCLEQTEYPCNEGSLFFRIVIHQPASSPFVTSSSQLDIVGQIVNASVSSYSVSFSNGGTVASLDTTSGMFQGSVPLTAGPNFITVSVEVAGVTQVSSQLIVIHDPTPPLLSITSPRNNSATVEDFVLIQGTASDEFSSVVSVNAFVVGNGTIFQALSTTPTWSISLPLEVGSNVTIIVTAVDEAGNTATQSIGVIQPGTGVFLSCAPDANVECGRSSLPFAGAQLLNCDESLQTEESTFAICGTSSLKRRRFFACGASCVQTITESDNTPPVLNCPAPITVSCEDFLNMGVSLTNATASDTCMSTAPAVTGNEVMAGDLNLFCGVQRKRVFSSTDACSNMASCEQNIVILAMAQPPSTTTSPVATDDDGGGITGGALGGLIAGIILLLLILILAILFMLLWRKKKRREMEEAERLEILMLDNEFGEGADSMDIHTNDLYISNPNVSTESQDFAKVL